MILEKKNPLYIGLISGTSMDGIDAVLLEPSEHRVHHGLTYPYSAEVKELLRETSRENRYPLSYFSQINTLIGRDFANATLAIIEQSQVSTQTIRAIGSHGQTLCHDAKAPIPYTLQLGCPHTIAEMTGLSVVADFRTRDLIIGGQGAPFAPLYHQVLFPQRPLAVLNMGGISNLSLISATGEAKGYDLGPGNCLLDAWIFKHLKQSFDKNGSWAASGLVIPHLLKTMLEDEFFQQAPPKSIGKEYFSLDWLNRHLKPEYRPVDVQATLLELTATLIAQASHAFEELLICGGGVHNRALLQNLQAKLPEKKCRSTAELGIDPDFIEASMFAWMAAQTLERKTLDLQKITGATHPTFLGAIYPGENYPELFTTAKS